MLNAAQLAATALALQVAGNRLDYLDLDDIVNGFMCQPTPAAPSHAWALMRRVVDEQDQAHDTDSADVRYG